ncbi:glycosyltransferase [Brevibacillus sp. 7WMA2]|uniref:SPBc2 prophage-derived glycosyltransferase n=1 Tax=Brevibacillus laterosporus LMG 15441 TaxID=1042163 RepID=A0A075R6N3_BRELA|nr:MULTISPECIES: glycosyltransferase [Brevibacillus]AIG27121.1 SPBc2 prophage-derived glycosyltransferase [Brevibacillus laterosporus LMG 15441]AUM65531.1 tetratricopeptide repeat protein [Brevibacillus laterosporus]AYK08536.1 glycosyltransferase [Brevibacillus laterosporus]MBA4532093.1 glycosyltransferase [Brevibacillus halotolerans]MCR8962788.1 glycosyltransferase [Brevibacillus laterosporus]
MITISLCMIVKNEEDSLARCLDSVKDLVDEINIIDTGSTDGTVELAKQYTDRVFFFEWIDDFSAARNFAFTKATQEYILHLDADDFLLEIDRERLRTLKETLDPAVDSVTMKYHTAFDEFDNPIMSFRRNRLVKRSNNFQWIGAVHEYLAVWGKIIDSDIAVTHKKIHQHEGYSTRNLRIYEKKLERGEEFTIRDLYYYANELRDHSFHEKAIEYYIKMLDSKQGWIEDEINACYKIADCYVALGDKEKELEYIIKAFSYDTPRAEACCRLGHIFFGKKEYLKAIFWYDLATKVKRPDSWGFFTEACWTWLPHIQLCVCYNRIGQNEKAYEHNEQVGKYRPNDPKYLFNKKLIEGLLNKEESGS